jgi:proteasome accessory factor B
MTVGRAMLVRQWKIVRELAATRRGLSVRQLVERVGVSKPTILRDLKLIESAGAPLVDERVSGEVRYRLLENVPPLSPTAAQVAALRLARRLLDPFEGTGVVNEYDALLASLSAPSGSGAAAPAISLAAAKRGPKAVLRVLQGALDKKRRVRLIYRAASHGGEPREYVLDPVGLHHVEGELYFVSVRASDRATRVLKVRRVLAAEAMSEPAEAHSVSIESLFSHSVKAWTGDPVDVRVRLSPAVGWRVEERPLGERMVVKAVPGGDVIVSARVAGLVEATWWVIGWGAEAEALSPPELRRAVGAELGRAAENYAGDEQGGSRMLRRGGGMGAGA